MFGGLDGKVSDSSQTGYFPPYLAVAVLSLVPPPINITKEL